MGCLPKIQFTNSLRCVLFIILEGSFIALACALQKHPVVLPHRFTGSLASSLTSNFIKSAFGTVFNTWHIIASAIGLGVLLDAYSREWKRREEAAKERKLVMEGKGKEEDEVGEAEGKGNDKDKGEEEEEVDSVSIITSGWLDRIPHFLARNPTKPSATFRWAFVASVSMLALLQSGPSTIVVDNGTGIQQIATGGLILGTSSVARSILDAEHVLGLSLGYATQANWVIPKPAYNASENGGSIEYTSDLIHFDYSCQWHAPEFRSPLPIGGEVVIGGEGFDFRSFRPPPNSTLLDTTTFGTAVYSLVPYAPNPTSPTSAFLIFGGNSTFQLNTDPFSGNTGNRLNVLGERAAGNTIDLSGLPTVYNASWFNISGNRFKASDGRRTLLFRAPLVTALLCNPRAVLNTGRVRLASNNLTVQVASTLFPRVRNIDENDIPKYFSRALDGVGQSREYVRIGGSNSQTPLLVDFTALAMRLLLPEDVTDSELANGTMPPLSPEAINRNMNAFVLSASKAQMVEGIGGFTNRDLPANSGPMQLQAEIPLQQQVLVSSSPWLGMTAFNVLFTFTLCCYITYLIHEKDRTDPTKRPQFVLKKIREGYVLGG